MAASRQTGEWLSCLLKDCWDYRLLEGTWKLTLYNQPHLLIGWLTLCLDPRRQKDIT